MLEGVIILGIVSFVVLGIGVGLVYRAIKDAKNMAEFDNYTPIGDLNDVHGKYDDVYDYQNEREQKNAKTAEEKVVAEQKAEFVEEQKREVAKEKTDDMNM